MEDKRFLVKKWFDTLPYNERLFYMRKLRDELNFEKTLEYIYDIEMLKRKLELL
jgi:NADH:ubiquinone oxidoreductase subunit D